MLKEGGHNFGCHCCTVDAVTSQDTACHLHFIAGPRKLRSHRLPSEVVSNTAVRKARRPKAMMSSLSYTVFVPGLPHRIDEHRGTARPSAQTAVRSVSEQYLVLWSRVAAICPSPTPTVDECKRYKIQYLEDAEAGHHVLFHIWTSPQHCQHSSHHIQKEAYASQ